MAQKQRAERRSIDAIAHPPIVSQRDWIAARKELLQEEKELTKHYDRVNAERRRLPMIAIEKPYRFDGPEGSCSLLDLFDRTRQLIVYHFMFDPAWDAGCPGCTYHVDSMGDISKLRQRDTRFVLVSRAPLAKLTAYKKARGWTLPWYSSYGTDFNWDFHVTNDAKVAPIEYNYRNKAELDAAKPPSNLDGEEHGLSVFFRIGDDVFHTYSAYARATERLAESRALLDMTPYGRQEDFEDSPPDGRNGQPMVGGGQSLSVARGGCSQSAVTPRPGCSEMQGYLFGPPKPVEAAGKCCSSAEQRRRPLPAATTSGNRPRRPEASRRPGCDDQNG